VYLELFLSQRVASLQMRAVKPGRENWVDDKSVKSCTYCNASFGLFTRRHHCRACGGIFCRKCSKHRIEFTPDSLRGQEGYVEKRERVCGDCHKRLLEARPAEAEAGAVVADVDTLPRWRADERNAEAERKAKDEAECKAQEKQTPFQFLPSVGTWFALNSCVEEAIDSETQASTLSVPLPLSLSGEQPTLAEKNIEETCKAKDDAAAESG